MLQICAPLNVVVLPTEAGSDNSYGNYSLAIQSEQVLLFLHSIICPILHGSIQCSSRINKITPASWKKTTMTVTSLIL